MFETLSIDNKDSDMNLRVRKLVQKIFNKNVPYVYVVKLDSNNEFQDIYKMIDNEVVEIKRPPYKYYKVHLTINAAKEKFYVFRAVNKKPIELCVKIYNDVSNIVIQ
uniref:Sf135 n=1 Tax=Spodoptera frugiperda nuclear polyhedrosis virus TaxID=10455 RepID=E9L6C9_NPVSF|nr:hypothetical protein Sf135 [Spodoptera frugiperda multiple nucleopolyhedrovirus]AFH59078.1 hypothetical protein Sf135 [Spodoptera frugiperda multiple nucleopolyhedrovirus]QED40334.1 hypothetical protein [Spodoptera frugiperda multiple nucleopolyhedrovirus]QRN46248.1 Sf135 [Spodoptera frugiperda multiple nucleopolyhedrovirus]